MSEPQLSNLIEERLNFTQNNINNVFFTMNKTNYITQKAVNWVLLTFNILCNGYLIRAQYYGSSTIF